MEDAQFRRLLERFGLSWDGYRRVRKGVKKRIARHMQETGCRNVGDYIEAIEKDPELRVQFECLMTVSISRFFRDRELWEALQERILPMMAGRPNRMVRAWSAGCASGEEPYSLKILWEYLRRSSASLPDLSILATDLCPEYLERARVAIYPPRSVREVPDPMRSHFFEKIARAKVALRPWLKGSIEWRVHNLLSDPPGTVFDLIFLRNNLLTYYQDELKIPAFAKVLESLAPGGFLIIGSHERMPFEPEDLERWDESRHIFQKRHSPPPSR